jgi:F-type H+-transporting ATPase subunit epsilon
MASEIQLRIVTPKAQILDQPVLEVTAPGTVGEFGVLPDHANFLSSLEIGPLSYKDSHGVHALAVKGGFAEVSNNVMTVLVEDAVSGREVDPVSTRDRLRAAEEAVAHLAPVDPEFAAADAERRWAQARLEVAGR